MGGAPRTVRQQCLRARRCRDVAVHRDAAADRRTSDARLGAREAVDENASHLRRAAAQR